MTGKVTSTHPIVGAALLMVWPSLAFGQLADMAATMAVSSQLNPTTTNLTPADAKAALSKSGSPPAITLPQASTPAQASAAVATPVTVPVTIAPPTTSSSTSGSIAVPPLGQFSYGTAPYSLMFTTDQIGAMKSALKTYESIRTSSGSGEVAVTMTTAPQAPVVQEPSPYPVFYLSSIVYHNADSWVVWLRRTPAVGSAPVSSPTPGVLGAAPVTAPVGDPSLLRFTPKSAGGEVKLLHVSADRAEFEWHPIYSDVIGQRAARKLFASIDDVNHRRAPQSTATYDQQVSVVRFSLKQNQSFSSGHFNCFEGDIAPVMPPPLAGGVTPIGQNAAMTPETAREINNLLGNGTPSPTGGAPSTQPGSAPLGASHSTRD